MRLDVEVSNRELVEEVWRKSENVERLRPAEGALSSYGRHVGERCEGGRRRVKGRADSW